MTIATDVDAPANRLSGAVSGTSGLVSWFTEQIEDGKSEPPPASTRMTYQSCLRTIGAWLDGRHVRSANVIEAPTGFVVRYVSGEDPGDFHEQIFTRAELRDLEAAMREHRGMQPNGRYGDFWRALGYEIDERAGENLLLDEIEGSLLVSYLYQTAETGLSWNKHASVLNAEDQGRMLRRAYARRREPERRAGLFSRMRRRASVQPAEAQG